MMSDAAHPPRMLPIMLDLTGATVFVVGAGAALSGRLAMLKDHAVARFFVFAAGPSAEAQELAGNALVPNWPTDADFAEHRPRLVFIADVADVDAKRWADLAHAVGAFVHVQDRIPLCDFHLPAILRRGHLQVTVSTDGTAAGLSRILRDHLAARVFDPAWEEHVTEVAAARIAWKKQGLTMAKLGEAIAEMVRTRGWLK
jgi:precorrin-2 dehydrogenase/sirohydrochlorin ferrochelatase